MKCALLNCRGMTDPGSVRNRCDNLYVRLCPVPWRIELQSWTALDHAAMPPHRVTPTFYYDGKEDREPSPRRLLLCPVPPANQVLDAPETITSQQPKGFQ